MSEQRIQRRLAAILAADVVGYSRLMEADEESVRARLLSLRAEIIGPRIDADGGRIVKTMGDGLLVEYPSAVNAVRSALAIRAAIARRNADVSQPHRIEFRIGINVGDVIIEDDDIHGDGVNVAARLEGLCLPGEVYVSGTVYDQATGMTDASFEDLGEQSVRNIARPIRVCRADVASGSSQPRIDTSDEPPPLPDKPSIAVLPFQNMSGDPEQEYFADGLAEDIITGLSKFHWFFVIARNSSFVYKGSSVDVKQIAHELGVQYVLEGSVRKAANRVRVTAQLIDALTGRHIWADRYDRDLEDIFFVQDEVTEAIVAAVAPSFISAEAQRIERKTPDSLDAWDYAMRGNWHFARGGREDVAEAKRLFEKALELDPKSTLALSGLTFAISFMIGDANFDDPDEARRQGLDAARRAVELDENDALAHVALSMSHFMLHEFDPAITANRQALRLNPNLAAAEAWLAVVLSWRGDADEAVAHAEAAMRLNPYDQHSMWSVGPTSAYFGAARYEEAVKAARKMIDAVPEMPIPRRYLIASLVHLGRMDEARAAKDQLLRIVPHESLRQLAAVLPSFNPERKHQFIDGLRKAGVPE